MANPLILTLAIDDKAQQYFNGLRKQYFPPERNFLDAQLTMFHQLPSNDITVINDIKSVASITEVFQLSVTGLMNTGNGVAFRLENGVLRALHKRLQQKCQHLLIPQDRQPLRPHITIQNKVSVDEARQLLQQLTATFETFSVTASGFLLWEYLGGPWKFVERFEFKQL